MDLLELFANLSSNDIPITKVAPSINAHNALTIAQNYTPSKTKVVPYNNQRETYNKRFKKIVPEYEAVPTSSSSANCMGSSCSIMGGKRKKTKKTKKTKKVKKSIKRYKK